MASAGTAPGVACRRNRRTAVGRRFPSLRYRKTIVSPARNPPTGGGKCPTFPALQARRRLTRLARSFYPGATMALGLHRCGTQTDDGGARYPDTRPVPPHHSGRPSCRRDERRNPNHPSRARPTKAAPRAGRARTTTSCNAATPDRIVTASPASRAARPVPRASARTRRGRGVESHAFESGGRIRRSGEDRW